jgi:Carbohydrate-selective porin, OprB family/S-layer homology domain
MKLFQQLLVAPAALGLLAPVAASAADMNLAGVNKYAGEEQVTSISQFSDVKPTDWAYQALSNLIERYGCVAGYPDGTYKGQRAMTRFEAAALLNACLDRVSEVTDELKKLMAEFEKELAILKGRVDGLEAKVGVLEAQQFSTTTKLKGIATMVLGGVSYSGTGVNTANNSANGFPGGQAAPLLNAVSFNYDVRLNFDTSFTGKDLLRTTLRAANADNSPFFGVGPTSLTGMEAFFDDTATPGNMNSVGINRLFYQFPVGSNWTATFGARVRQDDMLAMWPSVYPADTVLDLFTYAGSPQTYNLGLGAGAGLYWKGKGGLNFSVNYTAVNGQLGNPNPSTFTDAAGNNTGINSSGGLFNGSSGGTFTSQLGYAGSNWGAAVAYSNLQAGAFNYLGAGGLQALILNRNGGAGGSGSGMTANSVALSAYWAPQAAGWFPSLSAGWGLTTYTTGAVAVAPQINPNITAQSWYLGMQWSDVFVKGNSAGMALGQAPFITATNFGTPADGNFAWEWWYKFQVTDNISVTPAIFYLSQAGGWAYQTQNNSSLNVFGALLKTTFKF